MESNHSEPENVLGHALLENRDEGVYCYGAFNDTEAGSTARELVRHGDVQALSIYANQLKQNGKDVIHGTIREVSLVLAGANPGAFIDAVLAHGENEESEEATGVIAGYDERIVLYHSEDKPQEEKKDESEETVEDVINSMTDKQKKVLYALVGEALSQKGSEEVSHADESSENSEETVKDIIDSMNEKQKNVLYALVGEALSHSEESTEESVEENQNNEEKGESEMKHNIFDQTEENGQENVLSHDAMTTIISDAKRLGSMKESVLQHSEEYGIENISYLFPDNKNTDSTPFMIERDRDWVSVIMDGINHTPFSRVKTLYADITEDAARAKGYIKGKLKKEEVFSLLKRTTDPTTIYKKQKMDRDDMIDITDFEVVAWLKREMRLMLDEEIARAILIGDGRLASDEDKIDPSRIRPIADDHDLFVIRWSVATGATTDATTRDFMKACIKARKNYKGSGKPIMFTTEDWLTNMLLLEDTTNRQLFKTEEEVATYLRVSKIVTVPVLENATDKDSKDIYAIIVNPKDYTVGADKGGAINMFEDFDIDYNQQKYLIETRCSGALRKPFSAIEIRSGSTTQSEEPTLATIKATPLNS